MPELAEWTPGSPCRVVEHDEQTREPKPGGIVYPARVAEVTSMYVFAAYDDPEVYKRGRCDQFYADSGWRAWDGQLRWRLLPGTGDEAAQAAGTED
jgi:hypothetical protein